MSIRQHTRAVDVGGVTVGGGAPIVVQAMTDTQTADVEATAAQVAALAEAGAEIVRLAVHTPAAADAVPVIKDRLIADGVQVPLVGDFHYNGHKLLSKHPLCAAALDKYRINPGNVGKGGQDSPEFAEMIQLAIKHDKPVRIGVNWGSLDQGLLTRMMDENAAASDPEDSESVICRALVASALESAAAAERLGLPGDRIVLSCKVSRIPMLAKVYRELAEGGRHALHLGLTEAGMGLRGTVASACALAVLLEEGIGDTVRVSITPEPGGDRCEEVRVARQVLQAMNLRRFEPGVSACPGCGRTSGPLYQELAADIESFIARKMPEWRERYPGVEELNVAVMGCVVNGPGESRHADIGISLPGSGERPVAPVYVDGAKAATLKGDKIAVEFQEMLVSYVEKRFGGAAVTDGR